ncbi:MAG: nucleotidyltransferase family protein [Herbinix sp.]|nr:nucleotidyltransferase family protein [Herbinix sp.]
MVSTVKVTEGEYLIHLLDSSLKNSQPKQIPKTVNLNKLLYLAKLHRIENLIYESLVRLQPDDEVLHRYLDLQNRANEVSSLQLAERDTIIQTLTESGIRVLPLKGCLLKEMYPRADMRSMADLDILIDQENANKAKSIMKRLGYDCKSMAGHHASYFMPPIFNVELHIMMVNENSDYYNYYKHVWNRAVQSKDNPYHYYLTWNDYYIYMLVHFAKHYFHSGSGIRSIMDIHIFINNHSKDLDYDYLKTELMKLNLWDFHNNVTALSNVWFAGGKSNDEQDKMAQYIILSGTYGNSSNRIVNEIQRQKEKCGNLKKAKINYFIKRAFLNKTTMLYSYPFLSTFAFMLPFCWVHRLIKAMLFKQSRIKNEIIKLQAVK